MPGISQMVISSNSKFMKSIRGSPPRKVGNRGTTGFPLSLYIYETVDKIMTKRSIKRKESPVIPSGKHSPSAMSDSPASIGAYSLMRCMF
jgi:hypothetical protein